MLSTDKAPFFAFSLALLNRELKEEFILQHAIARYWSQQNKPIIPKLFCNLKKESTLEIFLTILCDI